jgi:hypothetical protein
MWPVSLSTSSRGLPEVVGDVAVGVGVAGVWVDPDEEGRGVGLVGVDEQALQ